MTRHVPRRIAATLLAGGAALALVACGGGDDGPPRWDSRSVQDSVADAPFIPSVINSSLGVGENRVVLALVDRKLGTLVPDATVRATFFRLAGQPEDEPDFSEEAGTATMVARVLDLNAEHEGEGSSSQSSSARFGDGSMHPVGILPGGSMEPRIDAHEGDLTTVYTTTATFDRSGNWGALLEIETGGSTRQAQVKFWVLEKTPEPAIGDPAPRTEQPTLRDVADIAQISSALNPNEAMLDQTVAEALDSGKPVVVAFVTPSFCQTRYCGPVMEAVVDPAWQEYGDRVEFIHIEPYDLAAARGQGLLQPVPAVAEWGLRSEPFIFVVDGDGLVRTKLEGVTDRAELAEAIEAVLNPG